MNKEVCAQNGKNWLSTFTSILFSVKNKEDKVHENEKIKEKKRSKLGLFLFLHLVPLSYRDICTQVRTFIRKFTNTSSNLHSANKSSALVRWFSRPPSSSHPFPPSTLPISVSLLLCSSLLAFPTSLLNRSTSVQFHFVPFRTVPLHVRI